MYSACVHNPTTLNYLTIVGFNEHGYKLMPRVEETLAGYLSPASVSSLKSPALPSRPCRITSSLIGKAYEAACQTGGSVHTMAVLHAYQAELCRATDLSLRATGQANWLCHQLFHGYLGAMKRHLWLNLSWIKKRERSVQFTVYRLQAVKKQSEAFQQFFPRQV